MSLATRAFSINIAISRSRLSTRLSVRAYLSAKGITVPHYNGIRFMIPCRKRSISCITGYFHYVLSHFLILYNGFFKNRRKLLTNYYPEQLYSFFVNFRYTYCKANEKEFENVNELLSQIRGPERKNLKSLIAKR